MKSRQKLLEPSFDAAASVIPILHATAERGLLWTPGFAPLVAMKDGDDLWVGDSEKNFSCISQSRFGQLLVALGKRHGSVTAYQDAVRQSVVSGLPTVRFEAGWMATLRSPFIVYVPSMVALLMAHGFKTFKKSLGSWLKKQKMRSAFVPSEMETGAFSRKLIRVWKEPFIIVENRGVILQSETALALAKQIDRWWGVEREFCRHFEYGLMESIMNGASPLIPPGPIHHYFPLSEAMQARIVQITEDRGGGVRKLKHNAFRFDSTAVDAFSAGVLLQLACPRLKAIDRTP